MIASLGASRRLDADRITGHDVAALRVLLFQKHALFLSGLCLACLGAYAAAGHPWFVYVALALSSLAQGYLGFAATSENYRRYAHASVAAALAFVVVAALGTTTATAICFYVPLLMYGLYLLRDSPYRLAFVAAVIGGMTLEGVLLYRSAEAWSNGPLALAASVTNVIDVLVSVIMTGVLGRSYSAYTRLLIATSTRHQDQLRRHVHELRRTNDRLEERQAGLVEVRQNVRDLLRRQEIAARQLRASREQLEQFTYAASHDLKEPIRTVRSFMQVVAKRISPELAGREDMAEYFAHISRSTGAMHDLLERLLTYSRIGRQDLRPAEMSAYELVRRACATSADPTLAERVAFDGQDLAVVADAKLAALAVSEVVSNAIVFAHAGEPARLTCRTLITVDGLVALELEDAGIGVAGEYAEQVFELFRRLHTREAYPGPGIGLALVRRIAEAHGGSASLRGCERGGAAVRIVLPGA